MTTLLLALSLLACGGKTAADWRTEAQAALDAGDHGKAITSVDEGLKVAAGDKAAAWGLETVRLHALAKVGKGAETSKELERLEKDFGTQLTAALFRQLADEAKAANDSTGAIDLLAAGDKKFPDDPSFKASIDAIKGAEGVSPEEVERLKALGYL
ncbi:MAG: hypothetical protein FJ090_13980 [Deltaproteobacteria bacterium]|nr:hypothetical protein [Deltaproteobacteria bacterium]